jgi:hypothetical protein
MEDLVRATDLVGDQSRIGQVGVDHLQLAIAYLVRKVFGATCAKVIDDGDMMSQAQESID